MLNLTRVKSELLWLYRKGFKPSSRVFYAAQGATHLKDYLPDSAFQPLALTNSLEARRILNDKLLFERIVGAQGPVLANLALIERGVIHAQQAEGPSSTADLIAHVRQQPLVFKPVLGSKGKGVFGLRARGDALWLDEERVEPDALNRLLTELDGYLVTPWLRPAPYAKAIYPNAGNTLRVITVQEPNPEPGARPTPFIMAAAHKFGTDASAPTDNWSRGGLFAPLDVQTGRLWAGLEDLSKTQGTPVWRDIHPQTGAAISGVTIPGWTKLKASLLELVSAFPLFQYVGWDIYLTEDGFAVLEANPSPVIVSLQMTGPALRDARFRRFIAAHNPRFPGVGRRVVA